MPHTHNHSLIPTRFFSLYHQIYTILKHVRHLADRGQDSRKDAAAIHLCIVANDTSCCKQRKRSLPCSHPYFSYLFVLCCVILSAYTKRVLNLAIRRKHADGEGMAVHVVTKYLTLPFCDATHIPLSYHLQLSHPHFWFLISSLSFG